MVHAPRLTALCCGLLALCFVFTCTAKADTVTQSGTFTDDNQVLQIPFSTTTTQNYTFSTSSYATGGFDPILTLFSSSGVILPGDAASPGGSDAFLTDVLAAGSYILTLTEFPNVSNGTINGPNGFTTGAPSALFIDQVTGLPTTANYTVTYTSSPVTTVTPEPPSALLLFLPLGGVVVLNRRRLLASNSL